MFILRDLLRPLQSAFSDTDSGRERAHWFVFVLLAIIVPFTSSMTSNVLRSLQSLFGLDIQLNQPAYPWSQTIVCTGLLKQIKGRRCCLPLAFRFYLMKAMIQAQTVTTQIAGRSVPVQSKMTQAAQMLQSVAAALIGSAKSQARNAHAVINHLNFCLMATTLTWIDTDRIKPDPQRRHLVKGRTSFAFSDVRHLITNAALSDDFMRL